jgi:hypothetical protein
VERDTDPGRRGGKTQALIVFRGRGELGYPWAMLRFAMILVIFGCGKVSAPPDDPDAAVDEPDTTAPVITLTHKPLAIDVDAATFEWVVDDVSATFQCAIDGGSFSACTSPTMFSSLVTGSHQFQVLAQDPSGNTGSAMHAWMVEPPCTTSLVELESLAPAGWNIFSGGVLHAGQGLGTGTLDATFDLNFTGKGLILYVETGPSMGTMEVKIDNGVPMTVETNAAGSFSFQVPRPIASGLINMAHVLTVTCKAGSNLNCHPDYVDVTCN